MCLKEKCCYCQNSKVLHLVCPVVNHCDQLSNVGNLAPGQSLVLQVTVMECNKNEICPNTHMYARTRACLYIHTHACACTHTHTHTHTHMHTHSHMHTHAHMCAHIHTHILTHAHTHTHTCTCTYTHTYLSVQLCLILCAEMACYASCYHLPPNVVISMQTLQGQLLACFVFRC